jgi:hypothetical protein
MDWYTSTNPPRRRLGVADNPNNKEPPEAKHPAQRNTAFAVGLADT